MELSEVCERAEVAALHDEFAVGLDRMFGAFPIELDLVAMESVLNLFQIEGVLHTPFGRSEGRDAIRAGWMRVAGLEAPGGQTRYVRHHITSREVIRVDDETYHSTVYVQGLTQMGLDHWGCYEDRIVRQASGWKFAERLISVDGCIPGGYYAGLPDPVNPQRNW